MCDQYFSRDYNRFSKMRVFSLNSIYDDVDKAFDAWIASGTKVYIYSSGSVAAQKLLFGHSEAGDLLPKLSGHFDTKVGPKQQADSYSAIVKELALGANEVLFLTDVIAGSIQ